MHNQSIDVSTQEWLCHLAAKRRKEYLDGKKYSLTDYAKKALEAELSNYVNGARVPREWFTNEAKVLKTVRLDNGDIKKLASVKSYNMGSKKAILLNCLRLFATPFMVENNWDMDRIKSMVFKEPKPEKPYKTYGVYINSDNVREAVKIMHLRVFKTSTPTAAIQSLLSLMTELLTINPNLTPELLKEAVASIPCADAPIPCTDDDDPNLW